MQKNAKVNFQLTKNKIYSQDHSLDTHAPKEVYHEGIEYVGIFLHQDKASLREIETAVDALKIKMENYLGESLDNYPPIVIFSQCFIG